MKKHLVMIVGKYFPNPSPTGKCAEAYVELLKDQFDISVICLADLSRKVYCYNDKWIYPAADVYTIMQNWLEARKFPGIFRNIAKVPVHIVNHFVQPNLLYSYVAAAEKQLKKVQKEKEIDVIFSVGAPMAAHVAARNFRQKHPGIRWITYTVDSYAAQNRNSRQYQKALEFEKEILDASDQVLLSEEIYNNNPSLYIDYAGKCIALPYLMPSSPVVEVEQNYFDSEKTNLVYAGRFYKTIRNPEYLLQLALEMDDSCVLHLYCQSDCDSMIDDYVARSRGKIVRHSPVSVDEIQKIYTQADVLVSVGNNTPEFMPSKTFEYIASGRPILNIYYEGQRDTVLEQYPLCLQVGRDGSLQIIGRRLGEFVTNAKNKCLTREQIDEIFSRYSSKNIKNILRDIVAV